MVKVMPRAQYELYISDLDLMAIKRVRCGFIVVSLCLVLTYGDAKVEPKLVS